MYTVKLTFLRRKPLLRQILKTNETNKNTDMTRKICGEVFLIKAAAQCPEKGLTNLVTLLIANYILNGVGNDNYNTFR